MFFKYKLHLAIYYSTTQHKTPHSKFCLFPFRTYVPPLRFIVCKLMMINAEVREASGEPTRLQILLRQKPLTPTLP